jgi:hypothetical protein
MDFRPYEAERDLDAVYRIHGEAGWPATTDTDREATGLWHGCGTSMVAELNGEIGAFASNVDGSMRYLDATLSLCVVGGVATSHVARRHGLATRVTAEAIAEDVVEKNAAVAVLGMFDQGFYDRLGFGSGGHDLLVAFDPADLRVAPPRRVPVRLTAEDAERMHRGRAASRRPHGGIVLDPPEYTRGDMLVTKDGFGLGFENEDGELTHHIWVRRDDRSVGPYWIRWAAYRTREEFQELMGLVKSFADQVQLVRFITPPDVQLWDLLDRPWRRRMLGKGGDAEAFVTAIAWWQARICDLEACVAAARLPGSDSVRFNLALADPIADRLTEDTAARWAGVGGDYVVTFGPASSAERRAPDPDLPTMQTSVNTFTRLWLGVQPPTGLAITAPDLDAPEELLQQLDRVLRLPRPAVDWDI